MPTLTSGIRYPPVGPVVAAYSEEVSTPFATTCALATIAPVESSTVPAMDPRSDWLRTAIPENARRRPKERYLSKDRLNRILSPPRKKHPDYRTTSASSTTESQ